MGKKVARIPTVSCAPWARGRLLHFHRVAALFCQAGARPVSSFSLREAFLVAPRARSQVARAAHRVQPSDPPSRATEQGRPAPGPLAVRRKPRQRYPTAGRPLGTRTLRRDGSFRPRGGSHHHPPALPPTCSSGLAKDLGGGYSNRQAGASGHLSRDRGDPARGPGRGFGDAASCGHRGAPARNALLGRGRGSLGAQRAGASKRRGAAHPLGKTKPSRSD
jgi:hypothetical protein